MPDLGSGAARRVGSSPILGKKKLSLRRVFFCPGRKPTIWLPLGLEVKGDVFRFEKPTEPALGTGRVLRPPAKRGVLSWAKKNSPLGEFFFAQEGSQQFGFR